MEMIEKHIETLESFNRGEVDEIFVLGPKTGRSLGKTRIFVVWESNFQSGESNFLEVVIWASNLRLKIQAHTKLPKPSCSAHSFVNPNFCIALHSTAYIFYPPAATPKQ